MSEALRCKQLEHLPVVSESQQKVLCPKCTHYYQGKCSNPTRTSERDECPFDGKELPVEEVKSERVRISIEKIMECEAFRREVNSLSLDQIDLIDGGKVIDIPQKYRDEWKFTGLGNWHFFVDGAYKEGWTRLFSPVEEDVLKTLGFSQDEGRPYVWNTKIDRDGIHTVMRTNEGFEWYWQDGYGHFKEAQFANFEDLVSWIKEVEGEDET